jgi:hypothetical protein
MSHTDPHGEHDLDPSGGVAPEADPATDGSATPEPPPRKKRRLTLDIDEVDISEKLERKISA